MSLEFTACGECGALTGVSLDGEPRLDNSGDHAEWHRREASRVAEAAAEAAGRAVRVARREPVLAVGSRA